MDSYIWKFPAGYASIAKPISVGVGVLEHTARSDDGSQHCVEDARSDGVHEARRIQSNNLVVESVALGPENKIAGSGGAIYTVEIVADVVAGSIFPGGAGQVQ